MLSYFISCLYIYIYIYTLIALKISSFKRSGTQLSKVPMASSSYSLLSRSEYDVFLSFRGEDTSKTFVGCLYTALNQRGIRTFKDDERLERGKSISSDLVKNINESSIAVIVFSKNYANSSWCLEELVEILECRRTKGLTVLPIFYDVKASNVRKQRKSFAEAFRQHEEIREEEMERVQRWRDALKEAANVSGFDLEDVANGYEEKFIQQIVQVIFTKLQPIPFKVAEYEVGIDSRANKVIMLLNDRSKDKLFVGICGIGGIGKTTVAKAVFNQISNEFERSCFLKNVREESKKQDGLTKLQQKLLRETLMDNYLKISNSDRGINEIKDRLGHKKILLVLDDVDDEIQLTSLAGIGHNWFGSGSRIIITTRDERLLMKYNIVKTYKAELLDDEEALELFSWHAFKQNDPVKKYRKLSHTVKDYAKGLPLALQVLGSFLHEISISEWVSELNKLKRNPPKEIQDVLKISYDSLDKKEKAIFLDIACYFKGYKEKFAMEFFESCGFHPIIGIKVLIERSLITISKNNELQMHDLIQEMGREIVRQESEDPGKRSRLWSHEDIDEVFTKNMVTENIEAIMVTKGGLDVSGDAFTKMKKLRILKISDVQLHGSLTNLSNELRYLDWNGYPEEYLPYNFHAKKLVQLHLRNSLIKGIWTDRKILKILKVIDLSFCKNLAVKNPNFSGFPFLEKLNLIGCASLVEVEFDDMKFQDKLKIVDLSYCKNLKRSPNLSQLPCLEKLYLHGCRSLVEVHPSIEFHERLHRLRFDNCKNLKILATRINLKSLQSLNIDGCSKLEKFPEIQGDMECLETLMLDGTALKELPPSIGDLKRLKCLTLRCCRMIESLPNIIDKMKSLKILQLKGSAIKDLPPSIEQLESLMKLDLYNCKMLGSLPSNIGEMKSLRILWLSFSGVKKLPPSIQQSTILQLEWSYCNLDEESILNLPHSLWKLNLNGNDFVSLPASFSQLTSLYQLGLNNCLRLQALESLPASIRCLSLRGCSSLQTLSLPSFTSEVLAQGCVSLERYSIQTSDGCIFTESHKLVENHKNKKPNIYDNSEIETFKQNVHEIVFSGSEIPSWFSHIYESQSGAEFTNVRLNIDPNSFRYLKGVSVCAVIEINQDHKPEPFNEDEEKKRAVTLSINGDSRNRYDIGDWINRIRSDMIMLFHEPNIGWKCNSDGYCYIEASISGSYSNGRPLKVKKWGVHPVMDVQYEDDEDGIDENEEEGTRQCLSPTRAQQGEKGYIG
ncbi:disease resistance protein RUN1-like isoform X2 [Cornus florida]|nr:disease resistance protein RUN1-like isoform X2 [Cornus florida]XP_059651271.1 disease resistance protein RUN1-like isoform X2 [Cornus florida]